MRDTVDRWRQDQAQLLQEKRTIERLLERIELLQRENAGLQSRLAAEDIGATTTNQRGGW